MKPLIAVFLVAVFALSVFDITEHDYWWHLATGRYILQHRTIPNRDVFSFTATRPWVAHYWLADIVGYSLYRRIGTPGMILLNALVITLSFRLVLKITLPRSGVLMGVAFGLFAAFASRPRFYVRPETVSFFFMAVYLSLYYRWKEGGRRWPLFLFPPLQMLWTNLYGGGSVIGLVLLGSFSAGEILDALAGRCAAPRRRGDACGLALAALAAFCLSFVNPNTYRAVFYFLMSRDPTFRHIVEWRRMGLEDLLGPHGVLLALGAFLMLRYLGDAPAAEVILFAAFAAMSVDAPRSLPFFAVACVPLLAPRARRLLLPLRQRRSAAWAACAPWAGGAFAAAVLLFTLWYLVKDAGKFQSDYTLGLGVNKKLVPAQAVDFIERNRVEGPIFNSYGIGGYLIWRLYPRFRVFVDGRVEMYGTEFLKTYMLYWRPEVWNEYVRKYGITCAIIDREPNYTTEYLDDSPDWALVFFDDRAMVYLRSVPRNAALIRRFRYRYLRPGAPKFAYLDRHLSDPMTAGAVIEELKRSLGEEGYNLNSRLMLGYCYTRLGRKYYPLAIEEYRAAARLMPEGKDIGEKILWLERQAGAPIKHPGE